MKQLLHNSHRVFPMRNIVLGPERHLSGGRCHLQSRMALMFSSLPDRRWSGFFPGLAILLLLAIAFTPLELSAQQNAVPTIDQPLAPASIAPGEPAFKLTVNGAGFATDAVVMWNGSARATQFVSTAQLTASILASDIVTVGTAKISVFNPLPGGGTSSVAQFPVADPRGTVTFARTDYPAARLPAGLASADFNGDGALDLVASNQGDNTISVFLGDVHGSFGAKHDYATGVNPGIAAVGDFNGDGVLDLAVPNSNCSALASSCENSPPLNGTVSIFLGNGDGTFKPGVDYVAGPWTTAVMVGDLNHDGKLDLIAVNGTCPGVPCFTPTSSISVLLGNGDGTFRAPVDYTVGLRPVAGVVGDFNKDGELDVAVSNDFDSTVSVLLGNGDGTFQNQRVLPIGPKPTFNGAGVRPTGIVTVDLNNDGKLDLVVANEVGNTFSVLLGNGDGTFKPEVEYPTSQEPELLSSGDFNGDGVVDFVVTNTNSNTVSLYLGKGDGTFQAGIPFATTAVPYGIASGDFDHDGRLDVAVASEGVSGALTGVVSAFLTAAVTPAVTVTPSESSLTTKQELTVTIEVSSGTGEPIPTGSVTLTSGAFSSTATTLTAGIAMINLEAGSLAVGIDPITVRYTPDAASSVPYNSAVGTATVRVAPATPTVTVTPSSPSITTLQQLTVAVAVSSNPTPTGSVTLTSGSYTSAATALTSGGATITIPAGSLSVGTDTLTVKFTPDAASSSIYNSATGSSSVTVTPPSTTTKLQFVAVTPCRVADTRNATGAFGAPELAGGSTRTFNIPQSACSIPATAAAYSLNVTVVPDKSLGYLTVWPAGEAQPRVSLLNSDGRVKANATITPAGANGGVSVYASDQTQFILDIDGYFVPAGTSASGLEFYPLTPCRVADTRNPTSALGGPSVIAATKRAFPVQSSGCGIPATAKAYSLNVTAVPYGGLGFVTAWPTGQPQPLVSTLNAPTGAVTANAAIVPAGMNGEVSIYVSDDTDIILDVNGYFAAPGTGGLSLYTVAPCRVIDTRNGAGAFNGGIKVPVENSACAVPAAARAYVLNATVLPTTSLGYLTLWPDGTAQPTVSTLNASDGAVTSNMAIVPTTNGSIDVFAAGSTQLILDISNYFAP
jgi:hypothetical protein